MFSSVKAFEGQQYSALKKQCLQSGTLFEDPFFPAVDDSLFYQGNRIGRVHWKRPGVSHLYEFLTSTVCTGLSWEKRISSSLNNLTLSCWYWSMLCCLNSHLVYTVGELCSIYSHPMVSSPRTKGCGRAFWEMVVCYMKHLSHVHFRNHLIESITHLIKMFDLLLWGSEEGACERHALSIREFFIHRWE